MITHPEPFFLARPEQAEVLRAEATRWLDTPFRANSGAVGERGGTDCLRLAEALLRVAGAIPAVRFPRYAVDSGTHLARSPLLEFLRGRGATPSSAEVARHLRPVHPRRPRLPGDLLVIRYGRTPFHVGVATNEEGDFAHVRYGGVVMVSSLRDSQYGERLHVVFRAVANPVAREVQT